MPKITPLPSSKLRKVFEKAGFTCVRIEGDHYVYTKPGISRPVVIPDWPEVPELTAANVNPAYIDLPINFIFCAHVD